MHTILYFENSIKTIGAIGKQKYSLSGTNEVELQIPSYNFMKEWKAYFKT
jgi:hypothetical protein